MFKRIVSSVVAIVMMVCCVASFGACDTLSLLGDGNPGEGWQKFGDHFSIGVSHQPPRLSMEDRNSSLSHVDSCEVEIGRAAGGSYQGADGHYVFKNAAIIKTLTIDGEDYTIRIPVTGSGEAGGFTNSIRLKRDTEKSKVTSGYIRNSGFEGYYKVVPHTLEEGETYTASCESEGYTEMRCTGCRYTEKKDVVNATGHKYGDDGVCTVCQGTKEPENNENNDSNNEISGGESIGQIGCTHTAYLDLDVGESSLGVNTGRLDIKLDDPELLSSWEAISTKPQIIKIDSAELSGNILSVHYTVMGHGEADILVTLKATSINAERLCEIHVKISDK